MNIVLFQHSMQVNHKIKAGAHLFRAVYNVYICYKQCIHLLHATNITPKPLLCSIIENKHLVEKEINK